MRRTPVRSPFASPLAGWPRLPGPRRREARVSRRAARHGDRHVLRNDGRRPVPLAGRRRRAADDRVGESRRRPDALVSRRDPAAHRDPRRLPQAASTTRRSAPRIARDRAGSSRATAACRTRACCTFATARTAPRARAARSQHARRRRHRRARRARRSPATASYLAYATQSSGADWQTWHVKDVATGSDLPDTLEWSKFSGATWVGDSGFYYEAYDPPQSGNATLSALGVQKLYFHRLGTPQSADRLVFASTAHPDQFLTRARPRTSSYYFFSTRQRQREQLGVETPRRARLARSARSSRSIRTCSTTSSATTATGSTSRRTRTRRAAGWPALDVTDPSHALHDIVAAVRRRARRRLADRQHLLPRLPARRALASCGSPICTGVRSGRSRCRGSAAAACRGAHREDRFAYYTFTSFTFPTDDLPLRHRDRQRARSRSRPKIAFDPTPYVTEQLFDDLQGRDAHPRVRHAPQGHVARRHHADDVYGYGGFDISITPSFSSASPLGSDGRRVRGRDAARRRRVRRRLARRRPSGNKQHVFDDFIAASQC